MFDKWLAKYRFIKNLLTDSESYTVMLVPDDGKEIHRRQVETETVVRYGKIVGYALAAAFVGTALVYANSLKSSMERQELADYKANKAKQEQQVAELNNYTEKIQQQLAEISKLEDNIRGQMQEAGMKVPEQKVTQTEAAALGGKGGGQSAGSELQLMLAKQKYLHANLEAKIKQLTSLSEVIKESNYRKAVTPDFWPVDGGVITSYFGGRANPFDGVSADYHPGIDIAASYGTPIYAGASGYVQRAGWFSGYGIYARISHDFGYETAYGHMSRVIVNAGDYVKKGQVIGYVGSTGYSTGPHLHYEVMLWGRQVNPLKLIK